jgi:hypothetical protein
VTRGEYFFKNRIIRIFIKATGESRTCHIHYRARCHQNHSWILRDLSPQIYPQHQDHTYELVYRRSSSLKTPSSKCRSLLLPGQTSPMSPSPHDPHSPHRPMAQIRSNRLLSPLFLRSRRPHFHLESLRQRRYGLYHNDDDKQRGKLRQTAIPPSGSASLGPF